MPIASERLAGAVLHRELGGVMRGMSSTSLQWAGGAFCAVLGALMLVAPYQFSAPAYSALHPYLALLGVALLLAGAALVCAAVLAPRRAVVYAAHLLAGGGLLLLAWGLGVSGAWSGVPPMLILSLGTAVAPILTWAARPAALSAWDGSDLFALLLGLATAATGLLLLLAPAPVWGAPMYDQARPHLAAYGTVFVAAGLALAGVQVHPPPKRWAARGAHVFAALALFTFLFAVAVPARTWIGVAYYGGFGTFVLLLPWLGQRLQRLDSTSLRVRLALTLGVATAVPLLVVVPLYAREEQAQAVSAGLTRDQALATALAQDVADFITLHEAAVQLLAAQPGLLALSPAEQHEILRSAKAAYPDSAGFGTVSADGEPLARADDRRGTSFMGDPMFEAVRQTRQPSLQVLVSPVLHLPIFSIGAPVLDADGRLLGLVATAVESSRIAAVLGRVSIGEATRIYLVDARGRAIAHPDPDLVARFADLSDQPVVATLLRDPADAGSVRTAEPDDVMAGYARAPGLRWGVIIEQPTAVALAATRAKLDLVFWGLILAVIAAAGLGVLVAGRLTRALTTLSHVVEGFAAEEVSAPLPHSTVAEVGRLVQAFSAMRQEVAQHTAELEMTADMLQRERGFLQVLLDNLQVGITACDAEGRLTLLNPATRVLLGLPEEPVSRAEWPQHFELYAPDGQTPLAMEEAPLRRALLGEAVRNQEVVLAPKQGARRTLLVSAHALHGPDERVVGAVSAALDITDRKRAEEALRESETRLQAILEHSPSIIFLKDLDGRYLLVNRAFSQLLGPTQDQACGKMDTELFPASIATAFQEHDRRVLKAGTALQFEEIAQHEDGDHTSLVVKFPLRDAAGQWYAVGGIATDITERKRAEDALRDSEQRLRLALAGAHMGTWDWDLRTNTLVVSPTTEALYGYVPGTGPSTADGFEQTLHPDDREPVRYATAAGLSTDSLALEYRVCWPDGSIHWLNLTARVVRDDTGRPVRLLGVVADLTERKHAEAERAARAEAEAALRLRDAFLSVAAHELKTPITGLRGYAQLLLKEFQRAQGPNPERVRRALRTIDQQSVTLGRLVGQLLDVSRITAGRLALECEPTDLVALVRRAVSVAQARTRRHALHVSAPSSFEVSLDPLRIEQVLANLLDNAIKYSPEGGRIDVRVALAEQSTVRVTVRDRGLGIPPESRARIFEHSYQAHAHSHQSGLGLGLYISRQIVDLHGGHIEASFPRDGGTCLVVDLPLARAPEAVATV